MKTLLMSISMLITVPAFSAGTKTVYDAGWKSLQNEKPEGQKNDSIKCYTSDPKKTKWRVKPFEYNPDVATRAKEAKVIVINFNPKFKNGKRLIESVGARDPKEYSNILVKEIRECSGGYINYKIVDFIEADDFPEKIDGFKYDEKSYLKARKTGNIHRPDRSDYRKIFEKYDLINRCKNEGITEIWMWGGGGFGFDELAMYFPKRHARFAPTDNPWFYRPYEIPEEIGHSVWVMGFNYDCGPDNMLHSYGHRCESILALVFGHGLWNHKYFGKDPWNTFTMLNKDDKKKPSHCGNIHYPPNGVSDYDYGNKKSVKTYADAWKNYPDLSKGKARTINCKEWYDKEQGYQYGYMKWWMKHIPKNKGYTKWGYNNWWVYIANTDEDLPDLPRNYKEKKFELPGSGIRY